MNAYQKAKGYIFTTVKGRFLIGRKLILSFPTSVDGKVSVVALPDWKLTSFIIKKPSPGVQNYTLQMQGPDEQSFEASRL